MCLGIPGQVTEVREGAADMTMGTVNFGGVTKEVCPACVPEAQVGDWVIVHVGFAITRIDESEANRIFEYPEETDELDEIREPSPPVGGGALPSGTG